MKSEHLSVVIIITVIKEESSVSSGLPKFTLDDLKSLKQWLAELHVVQVIAWNIGVCGFL